MPSTGAIVIGLAHALLPYTVLTIMGSLNGINPNLEQAAMSLGANRTRFLHVVLPLSLPGIAGGFILAFSIAISAYATPAILGGPATQVMATAIYGFMTQLLDWSIGAALAVVLIVSSLPLVCRLSSRRRARRPYDHSVLALPPDKGSEPKASGVEPCQQNPPFACGSRPLVRGSKSK